MIVIALKLLGILILVTAGYAGLRAAPWFPTGSMAKKKFLELADIKPGEKFYDLGCGDGRMVAAAAEAGAKAVGFEISLLPHIVAKIRCLFLPNAKIRYRDFWRYNLSDADLVYFFLTPQIYPKLKKKFEDELKSGARVAAYVWPIEGWTPVKIYKEAGQSGIFFYEII